MKLLSLPTLALTCAALVFSTASAEAKTKHKKHHDNDNGDRHHDDGDHHDNGHHYGQYKKHSSDHYYTTSNGGERRGYYGESNLYHDGNREYTTSHHHSSGGRERRVVVYENRSYGYNYYDLQTVLQRDGYYNGPLDGDWGPGSRAALVRCQRDRGWHDDGVIDGQLIVNLGIGR